MQQADLRIRVARADHRDRDGSDGAGAPSPRRRVAARWRRAPLRPRQPIRRNHPGVLKSPMVGTAYLGAAPGAKPFVEIGSKVKPGRHAC